MEGFRRGPKCSLPGAEACGLAHRVELAAAAVPGSAPRAPTAGVSRSRPGRLVPLLRVSRDLAV